jgi:hypothetical protein
MTVSVWLRTAQRVLSTSIVAAVGASCLATAETSTSAAPDAGSSVVQTSKEFRVAPARKEYRQSAGKLTPARKEYRQSAGKLTPARKEYRQSAGKLVPARKEYRQTSGKVAPARKEYRRSVPGSVRRHVVPRHTPVS